MNDTAENQSASGTSPSNPAATPEILAKDIEKLSPETRTIVSVMMGLFKSTSGPDPETARSVAQSEMHEESCRLDGFKESLRVKDLQNDRDHIYRLKRLNHESAKTFVVLGLCVAGAICGLYLLVQGHTTLGSNLLTASFVAVLGGKSLLSKDKE
jgi:hypothetical protein